MIKIKQLDNKCQLFDTLSLQSGGGNLENDSILKFAEDTDILKYSLI